MVAVLFCPQCGDIYGCVDTDANLKLFCYECPYTSFTEDFGGECQYKLLSTLELRTICPPCSGVNRGTL